VVQRIDGLVIGRGDQGHRVTAGRKGGAEHLAEGAGLAVDRVGVDLARVQVGRGDIDKVDGIALPAGGDAQHQGGGYGGCQSKLAKLTELHSVPSSFIHNPAPRPGLCIPIPGVGRPPDGGCSAAGGVAS